MVVNVVALLGLLWVVSQVRPDRGGARIVELEDLIAAIRAKKTGVVKKTVVRIGRL